MRTAVAAFLAFALAACTHRADDASSVEPTPPATLEPAPTKAKTKGLVLATLVTHDAKVSILTGERVIVQKTDGTLVADGISVDELRAVDPLLHVLVRDAVASNSTYLDGTYHAPRLHAD
ncbi:MAG: hypothetical protein KIT84_44710 [Labilithrix sp.]|nr:hypothetical protein [Labilithrix sp.]MCW5818183.1 hypothetical protein [Labilithrix sp.]